MAAGRPLRKQGAAEYPARPASYVLDHDAVDLVGDVIEPVDHLLQVIVDLVADEKTHRVSAADPVKLLEAGIVNLVRAALDRRDPLRDGAQPAGLLRDRAEQRHRLAYQDGTLHDVVR